MALIPQRFIDELTIRADIVEVISSRLQLKKAGREFNSCCPFHNEKTPSFWVSPEKQFYHCFGCGAHGSVLRFLMEYDRMTFPQAVEDLALHLGVTLPKEREVLPQVDGRLYEISAQVAQFYSDTLSNDDRALKYLAQRGIDQQTIDHFGLGYAPNSWNAVLRRFGANGTDRGRLVELGLVIQRIGTSDKPVHYDRFRDRIMYPIRDVRGRIIGFGGRVIDQGGPKYLNSPDSPVFHKGQALYGLHEARRSPSGLKRLLVVEGYMDVLRLYQAEIPCAVATLGTATTTEHFNTIFRLVNEIVFAFDGDTAGRAAAWKAAQRALPQAGNGRDIRFLILPEGHDPDTLVRKEGRPAFEKRLESAVPLSEFVVQTLSSQTDLSHADGRARFAELARPLIDTLPEGVYRELLVGRIAQVVGLAPARLQELWTLTRFTGREASAAVSSVALPAGQCPTPHQTVEWDFEPVI